ncbi:RHS repeat domain-containing protein [Oscillospiraceae bacterium 44-34]
MGRVMQMDYPHGWVKEYTYDAIGQLLNVTDITPGPQERAGGP